MNYYGLAAALPLAAVYRAVYGENTWLDKLAAWHARGRDYVPALHDVPADYVLDAREWARERADAEHFADAERYAF